MSREWGCKLGMGGHASHAETAQNDESWEEWELASPKGAIHLLGGMASGAAEVMAPELRRESVNVGILVDTCWSAILCSCQDGRGTGRIPHSQNVCHTCKCRHAVQLVQEPTHLHKSKACMSRTLPLPSRACPLSPKVSATLNSCPEYDKVVSCPLKAPMLKGDDSSIERKSLLVLGMGFKVACN